MRSVLALVAVAMLVACGDEPAVVIEKRIVVAPVPRGLPTVVAECRRSVDDALAQALRASERELAGTMLGTLVACADLYTGRCRAAWAALGAGVGSTEEIVVACSAELCARLAARPPDFCSGGGLRLDAPAAMDGLERLDRLVLHHAGVADADAEVLSRRARLFARRSLAATATDPAATPTRALRVEVTADEIFVAGDPVTEAELTARIAAAVDAGAVEHVMLAADDQVEYGRLVSIMDAIRKGGAKDIALTTK